jgi:hypothetical protein
MRSFAEDNRGLTMEFVRLLASLGVGAGIIYAVYAAGVPLLEDAERAAPGGMGGVAMNGWFDSLLIAIPFIFLLCAFFGFIVKAVYERGSV